MNLLFCRGLNQMNLEVSSSSVFLWNRIVFPVELRFSTIPQLQLFFFLKKKGEPSWTVLLKQFSCTKTVLGGEILLFHVEYSLNVEQQRRENNPPHCFCMENRLSWGIGQQVPFLPCSNVPSLFVQFSVAALWLWGSQIGFPDLEIHPKCSKKP